MIILPKSVSIVLDLDDTLYPEREFQRSGFRAVAERVVELRHEELVDQLLGISDSGGDALQYAAELGNVEKSELLWLYRGHHPDISLFADASVFLERLSQLEANFAILTDGRSVTQRNKLRALGLNDRALNLVVSEELGIGKPDPRVFLRATELLGGVSYAYFADNPAKDFIAPNQLGWTTIMLKDRGQNIHPQQSNPPAEYQAQFVIGSFEEVEFI